MVKPSLDNPKLQPLLGPMSSSFAQDLSIETTKALGNIWYGNKVCIRDGISLLIAR